MPFPQINSGSAITGTFEAGADSFFEKIRQQAIAAVFFCLPLGGSRSQSVTGVVYQDAINYVDFTMPDADSVGGVYKALVDVLCENAATSITPKIRNITDSSDAVVGSASTSTSWASQTLSFTPAAGKTYRLQFIKGDDVYGAFGMGRLQRTAA